MGRLSTYLIRQSAALGSDEVEGEWSEMGVPMSGAWREIYAIPDLCAQIRSQHHLRRYRAAWLVFYTGICTQSEGQ